MRVAILWTGLSGYLNACLRELASRPGVELFVAHSEPNIQAPYDQSQFVWMKNVVVWRGAEDFATLKSRLDAFDPQVVVVAGWHVPIYRRVMKHLKGQCLRIMTMDNPWRGTLKQRLGTLIARFHVLPIADAVWVPGYHQATFARKLKFPIQDILHGLFSCDSAPFVAAYKCRISAGESLPKAFLYVGRFSEEKGVETLAEAYRRYRAKAADPWPLIVCGTGPLRHFFENQEGVVLQGFVQPADLPSQLGRAGSLIVPSDRDAWSLAIHEATSAGLIIIATETVGAIPHLVQNYYNGFVVQVRDSAGMAETMGQISGMDPDRRERMSRASHELSQQYTPARWTNALLDFAKDRKLGEQ